MLLKCETTLNVYQHKTKTILCRVNAIPTKEGELNTCRSILTTDQWYSFDNKLKAWLESDDGNDWSESTEIGAQLHQFVVKPNLEITVRRSKLSTKHFCKCTNNAESCKEFETENCLPVLDCCLEYTKSSVGSKLPPTPSIPSSDEYEPIPTAGINNDSTSPSTYEPYTPSKKTRNYSSLDKIKTPGLDFLGFDSTEDAYSPKPNRDVTNSETPIPIYKPAPISEKRTSKDTEESIVNEVILESEDEQLPNKKFRSLRTRERHRIHPGEYIPQSQDLFEDVPAYKPTPIDDKKETEKQPKVPKDTKLKTEDDQASSQKQKENNAKSEYRKEHKVKKDKTSSKESKAISCSKESKGILSSSEEEPEKATTSHKAKDKKNEHQKSKEIKVNTTGKEAKRTSLSSDDEFEKASSRHKDSKKKDRRISKENVSEKATKTEINTGKESKQSSLSSEDEFVKASSKHKDKKKEKRNSKESSNGKIDQTTKEPKGAVSSSDDDIEKASTRHKNKEKRKDRSKDDQVKQSTERKFEEASKEKIRSIKVSPTSIRRSERSPSKPRRFIDEEYAGRKKSKTSPKNKALFGTDDDDDCETQTERSDTNNNSSSKFASAFMTPKPDKKNRSLLQLSSSSSSSSKKKRKRNDCEQEKTGMNKWLGKKDKSSDSHQETSKSSSKKSSKKLKSSKDDKNIRSKTNSPEPMDIVMLSEKEMESIRIKAKQQCEDNEKLRAVLEKVNVAPKAVDHLSLKDMTLSDLMDTFSSYKTDLDKVYDKYRNKDHVKSHDGANHCLVIGLIDQQIQYKMLEKLSDVYNSTNSTTQATLYANALLPEWILRVFMKRYDLERSDAIRHIEAQDAYKSYTDAQNENSFLDDL